MWKAIIGNNNCKFIRQSNEQVNFVINKFGNQFSCRNCGFSAINSMESFASNPKW